MAAPLHWIGSGMPWGLVRWGVPESFPRGWAVPPISPAGGGEVGGGGARGGWGAGWCGGGGGAPGGRGGGGVWEGSVGWGGGERTSRPTPPAPVTRFTSFDIGGTRNISTTWPVRLIFHTRPNPVVPSPVQSSPVQSNARPLVPGTPLAKSSAVGGLEAFGVKR